MNALENMLYEVDGLPTDFVRRVATLPIADDVRDAWAKGTHPDLRNRPTTLALLIASEAIDSGLPMAETLATLGVTNATFAAALTRVGMDVAPWVMRAP